MAEINQQKPDARTESKLAYRMRVLKKASFKKLNSAVSEAHERSGMNRIHLFNDMVHCMKKFGAGYNDYVIFHFWDKDDRHRDTYMTRFRSKALISHVNNPEYDHFFDKKDEFNRKFKDYIGRTFIDLDDCDRDSVAKFFEKHDKYFAKPRDGECGVGAEKLYKKDFESADAFYDYVTDKSKGFGMVEEVLENHPALAEVYPHAVNTMRMITLIGDDGKPYLIYACQKFGNNDRIVDNYGVQCPVNLKTGEYPFNFHHGDTMAEGEYPVHPYTGHQLKGYRNPLFKEAKEMVLKAAMVVPQERYIGWDVATTPNGPAIIEGNSYTAHDFWQLPKQTPGNVGIMPVIEKLVPSFKCRANAGRDWDMYVATKNPAYNMLDE